MQPFITKLSLASGKLCRMIKTMHEIKRQIFMIMVVVAVGFSTNICLSHTTKNTFVVEHVSSVRTLSTARH